jgi:hypothetical protein
MTLNFTKEKFGYTPIVVFFYSTAAFCIQSTIGLPRILYATECSVEYGDKFMKAITG